MSSLQILYFPIDFVNLWNYERVRCEESFAYDKALLIVEFLEIGCCNNPNRISWLYRGGRTSFEDSNLVTQPKP